MAQAITATQADEHTVNLLIPTEENQSPQEVLSKMTGYKNPEANNYLLNQLYRIVGKDQLPTAMALMDGIAPQTPLEGMMALQLVTLNHMMQNFASRMNNDGNTYAQNDGIVNRTTKLIRASTALMETLIKSRNQGKQVIQVQHVTVNEGGQAMLGQASR
jgi:hypothetical protein